jgi:hypothetical protein
MAPARGGVTTGGREELQVVLDFLPGDVLMVTRTNQLARSCGDWQACPGRPDCSCTVAKVSPAKVLLSPDNPATTNG